MELSVGMVRKARPTLTPLTEAESLFDEGMKLFELGKVHNPVFFDQAVECFREGARLFVKHHETPYSKAWQEKISNVLAAMSTIHWLQNADFSLQYEN